MPTLEWIGKDKVVNHHLDVPYKVLGRQYSGRCGDVDKTSPVDKLIFADLHKNVLLR